MATQLAGNVYWVGAVDWGLRHFHNHELSTHHGSSYNAYLVVGEKTALIDTVHRPFVPEMIARIREVIDPAKIDYIIFNHAEPDHAGGIGEILKLAPNAKVLASRKGVQSLQRFFPGTRSPEPVKSGDRLELGGATLQFLETPLLHWPDSMCTFLEEEGILFTMDAFGQHYATASRFDDEVDAAELHTETLKYFVNILAPFSNLVSATAGKLRKLQPPIRMIAPSHGVIWRKNPDGIIEQYATWAAKQSDPTAVILYGTIWEGTRRLAGAIADGFSDEKVDCNVLEVPGADRNDSLVEIFRAKTLVVGSPTHNGGPLPDLMPTLTGVKGLKMKNKIAATFGCFGWSGEAPGVLQETLEKAGFQIVREPLKVQWAPSDGDLETARKAGRELAALTRSS